MDIEIPKTLGDWNAAGIGYLPGHLGITFSKVDPDEVIASMPVEPSLLVWNGYLHAGSVVALADSCCGCGTVRSLPEDASGFTTIELKSNFIATTRDGRVECVARPLHQGRTTQLWDAAVSAVDSGKVLAHFRCTQMILWPC
jgi:1,4-dihydroxy-2-naphthoyl-CoA hydrolase